MQKIVVLQLRNGLYMLLDSVDATFRNQCNVLRPHVRSMIRYGKFRLFIGRCAIYILREINIA
jgi:hypothetical protein